MAVDILSQVNHRYKQAVDFHRCASHLFSFLALEGFSVLHKYQHMCEDLTQLKVAEFIITTYHTMPDEQPLQPQESCLKNKHRLQLSANDIWSCVKQHFADYRKWESETLSLYEECAKNLSDKNDIIAYDFVKNLALEVHAELVHITDMILAYNSIDWSLEHILQEQDTLKERYKYLIANLHPPYTGHHKNSDVSESKKGLYYVPNSGIIN